MSLFNHGVGTLKFTSLIYKSHTKEGPLFSTLEQKVISILHLGNLFLRF